MNSAQAYLYAALITAAIVWGIRVSGQLTEITKELKSIRERMDKK
jgi:hypothetical protein